MKANKMKGKNKEQKSKRIDEMKSWYSEKINITDKPKLSQREGRREEKMTNICNERGNVTIL